MYSNVVNEYVDAEIKHRQLRWLDHVERMSVCKVPEYLLFS